MLFKVGVGTIAVALMSFLLAMTLHPDTFAKLQADLDTVVGPDLLPDFADIEALPRVRGDCQRDTALASSNCRWCTASARHRQCVRPCRSQWKVQDFVHDPR
jgi:hypothetical protein